MKLLKLFLVSIVIVAFNCCKSSTKSKIEVLESMDEEITVDAVSNCIILDSSSAAHILLSENIYTVTASNHTAEYTSGELFSHIYISCKGRYFNLLDLDSSITINYAQERGVYAFFTDTYSLNDNSGSVTLIFNPTGGGNTDTLVVDAVINCIKLDNSNAAHISLSDNIYTVTASNHTAEYTSGELFSHIYISCKGKYYNLSDLNSGIIIKNTQGRGAYAFFTDTYKLDDNSGSVTLTFSSAN